MIFTPKEVAKNRFRVFKNLISEIDSTQIPLSENDYNNLVILPMQNFSPSGSKARLFYDKLCDQLDEFYEFLMKKLNRGQENTMGWFGIIASKHGTGKEGYYKFFKYLNEFRSK